jgi:predicted TIM-barrel fold metal-dependent hydrolase
MRGISRRGFLAVGGMGALGALTQGLGVAVRASLQSIRIDMHCHIFNARDVPTRHYVANEVKDTSSVAGWFLGVFAKVYSARAPCATKENEWLAHALASQPDTPLTTRIPKCPGTSKRPSHGFYKALSHCRWDNVLALEDMYRDIDLFTPAFVDLGEGLGRPMSNMREATALVGNIARLSGGRVHCLVAFDPMHQVLWSQHHLEKGNEDWEEPLATVQHWIDSQGAVGVKLYPPMGFAPLANTTWACPTNDLPSGKDYRGADGIKMFRETYGLELDRALDSLYDYCVTKNVPILAHANNSRYANKECARHDGLGSPEQWAVALDKYPTLRVCLGHFGGIIERDKKASAYELSNWTASFAKLMQNHPNAHADLSSLDLAIGDENDRSETKKALADLLADKTIAPRVLYGSDWSMLALHKGFERYPERLQSLLPDDQVADVMGLNAVRFLGLTDPDGNGGRLRAFWKDRMPAWWSLIPPPLIPSAPPEPPTSSAG